jgi:hypothetical protein
MAGFGIAPNSHRLQRRANLRKKWKRWDLHPPHAACKAASPLWHMRSPVENGRLRGNYPLRGSAVRLRFIAGATAQGGEPSKHEIWSLAATPTRRQPAYKHFFPLPLVTAPANGIERKRFCTRSQLAYPEFAIMAARLDSTWRHAFSCFGFG